MTPEPTPTWPTDHIISKLEAIAGGLGQPGSIAPAICQACGEASARLRELAAAKAELDRLKAALVKLKPYTECACPEDPETGRVSYHFNCARSGRKIIDEALKP